MGSSGWVLPGDVLAGAPTCAPRPDQLADLELLLSGALEPLVGLPTSADLDAVRRRGQLADGTPWSVPVTLEVPSHLLRETDPENPLRRALVVTDPEGTPLAAVDVIDAWPTREGMSAVGGPVRRINDPFPGPFASLRSRPDTVREQLPSGRVVGVIADTPLHRPQLAQAVLATRTLQAHLLVLVPVAEPGPDGLPPEALVRCVLAARERMPAATVVTVPLRRRPNEIHHALVRARVAGAYGATHLLAAGPTLSGGGPRVLVPRELAYDSRDGQWRSSEDIPARNQRSAMTADEIADLLDRGFGLPEWHTPPAVARELARARPPRHRRGLVVFFTGLAGSGKSTVSRRVAASLREDGERTVTLLDRDVVRRELAVDQELAGADPDRAVRRVGWIAAEVSRHHGVAICAPPTPSVATLSELRRIVRTAGAGFVLVGLTTPAEVCRRRERAKLAVTAPATGASGAAPAAAGAGAADDGSASADQGASADREDGTSALPAEADVVIDTTDVPAEVAAGVVLGHLTDTGWVEP